jgi:hypothetical protein
MASGWAALDRWACELRAWQCDVDARLADLEAMGHGLGAAAGLTTPPQPTIF